VGGGQRSHREAVTRHQDLSDGINAREVKAAGYAASGNLTTARQQMVNAVPNAWGVGLSPAAAQAVWDKAVAKEWPILQAKGMKSPPKRPSGQKLRDDISNSVWNNSVDALSAGAGNPVIRAGVLRLLATIPRVTVARSTGGGQRVLVLTAGPALFGGGEEQVLTVNAATGLTVSPVIRVPGQRPGSVSMFRVTRVTLAAVAAGKF
jgi:hypothetical protein